ncbi:hypothetical protein [Pedococcus cremeus]|uniref:hypothetical protein n=1 Tax=Pedococcus cremeus TaxID=587636 RepID=UPI000B88362A|nr:hypothetical protein [Pedococcus cremeus]
MVFGTKSRSEKVQEQAQAQAKQAAAQAAALKERVVPAAEAAAEAARDRAAQAKDWAMPRVEHGIELAAPRLEKAVEGLGPRVDTARDKIVDDLLPKVAEAITAVAAASAAARANATDLTDRGGDALSVLKGESVAKPKHRGGKVLITLGILAALAAAAAAFFKRSAPREDPWATPLGDTYTAPGTTGPASAASTAKDKVTSLAGTAKDKAAAAAETAKEKASEVADAAKQKAGGKNDEDTTSITAVDDVTGEPAGPTDTPFESTPEGTTGTSPGGTTSANGDKGKTS